MDRIARGALAGLAATAPMTLVMEAGRAAGLMGAPPPQMAVRAAGAKVSAGAAPAPATAGERAAWLALHFAVGAGSGAGYALLRPWLPRSPLAAGLLFGALVWATGYLGVLPAARLYPRPEDDDRSRLTVMLAAHAVFGPSLAGLEGRLARRD